MNLESETKKIEPQKELRKVDIFGLASRKQTENNKSRRSETGGACCAETLDFFEKALPIFDGDAADCPTL